jgi:hypothetical protein
MDVVQQGPAVAGGRVHSRKEEAVRRSKQVIIEALEREIWAHRRHIADYKQRHDKAVDALSKLASGMGRKGDGDHNWEQAMSRLAREELAAIAKMPLREGP